MASIVRDRWYDDACGTALALELVGERWALLVVRELMFGPHRFGQLRSALPGISANVLSQRLDRLEAAGIIKRRRLAPPADDVQAYELTSWGYEAETAIMELGRWAVRSPAHDPRLPLSAASLMLSFRTMIDRGRSALRPMTVGLVAGRDGFLARIDAGDIAIERSDPQGAELVIEGEPTAIAAIVYGGLPIADAEAAGMVRFGGNRELAAEFVTLFPLPPKAEAD